MLRPKGLEIDEVAQMAQMTDMLALKREGSASYEAEIEQNLFKFNKNRNNPFRCLSLLSEPL